MASISEKKDAAATNDVVVSMPNAPPTPDNGIRLIPSDDETEQGKWRTRFRFASLVGFTIDLLLKLFDVWGSNRDDTCHFCAKVYRWNNVSAVIWVLFTYYKWCTGQGPITVDANGERILWRTLTNTYFRQAFVTGLLVVLILLPLPIAPFVPPPFFEKPDYSR